MVAYRRPKYSGHATAGVETGMEASAASLPPRKRRCSLHGFDGDVWSSPAGIPTTRGTSATSGISASAIDKRSAGACGTSVLCDSPQTTSVVDRQRSAAADAEAAHDRCSESANLEKGCLVRAAHDDSSAASVKASESASSTCEPAALRLRFERMFLGQGELPRPSGDAPAASECTCGLILDVRTVIGELWNERKQDIVAACAPTAIDEMDTLAWALADALRGGPLLHPADTNRLGKRVASKAKSVDHELTAAKKGMYLPAAPRPAAIAERDPSMLLRRRSKRFGTRYSRCHGSYEAVRPQAATGDHWQEADSRARGCSRACYVCHSGAPNSCS